MAIQLSQDKDRRTGLIVSLTIHAILLVIFFFFGLKYIIPPPEEGMVINFGTTETGLGTVESEPMQSNEAVEVPVPQVNPTPPQPEVSKPVVQEQVVTQETEEEIAFKKEKEAQEKAETERKLQEERKRQEEQRLRDEQKRRMDELFAKAKAGEGKGGGEGNTKPGGNQGSLDGQPNVPHGGKGGSGSGVSFSLGGRKMMAPPRINDTSQETGKVVVDITVDKYGKVVQATPGARGSTTTSSHLYRLAREAALDTKFDANPNAEVQQKGTMTFVFVLE
jgi:outer membrane biosynthesis protein TonB